jgi:secondary thiamine-phosphate synthase enzyme
LIQAVDLLEVRTPGRGFTDLSARLQDWVAGQGIRTGLLTLWCRHTSASLVVQENASPDVRRDLETAFARLAPETLTWRHDDEGPDDMPAHVRTALTGVSLSVPVMESRLALGTWQAVYLWEHRQSAHRRTLALHLLGES